MFTVYIDDSGTSLNQQIAIVSGLIFPEKRLPAMEREGAAFVQKGEIKEFHTSVCGAQSLLGEQRHG